MTRGERIKKIRQNLNLTQGEFGRRIKGDKFPKEVSAKVVCDWELNKTNPSIETLKRIAELGNVSLEWLILGKDGSAKPYELGEMVQIPILAWIPAGFPEETPQEDEIIGYTLVDKEFARKRGGKLFAIVAKGNCMNPTLQDGDEVIFDPSIEPRNGDIVIARIGDNRYEIRRFFKTPLSAMVGHNKIELRPEDQIGYKSIEITPDMDIKIDVVGVVIQSTRRYRR